MKQIYHQYSNHDHLVWKTLFNCQIPFILNYASSSYIEALKEIKFSDLAIPNYDEVNQILLQNSGWSIDVVEGEQSRDPRRRVGLH